MAAATASVLLRDPFFKCKAAATVCTSSSASPSSSSSSSAAAASSSSVPLPLKWNPLSVHRLLRNTTKALPLLRFPLPNRAAWPFSELVLPPSPTADEESEQSGSLLADLLSSALQALSALKKPALSTAALLGILLAVASPSPVLADASHWTATRTPEKGSNVISANYDDGSKFGTRSDGFLPRFLLMELAVASLFNGLNSDLTRRHGREPKLQICTASSPPSSWVFDTAKDLALFGLNFEQSDIFTSHGNFRNQLVAPRTPHSRGRSGFERNDQISKISSRQNSLKNQSKHLLKAVATIEPTYVVSSNNVDESDEKFQFSSNLGLEVAQHPTEDSHEVDDREKLRRLRISKANKGNVPWNKGRKHSAETIRRIRERTKLAMQDPKVKMKLVNLGHAQTEETRIKIGTGVREGWQRRREKLMVQESCFFEWQNSIAEAARTGYAGEDELQWDSYKILDEQLKKEWLESIEKRKIMPKPKGSKRAPKSPEQRRKISEAISAKWADPGYRDRVCNALAKYHGLPVVGAERRQRKKSSGETPLKRESVKKKQSIPNSANLETKSIKKVIPKRKRNSAPLYKDPMASTKLEMIRKIREQRTILETQKREATERAKKLIAEAEKAAKALEIAALRSPLAQASLLETRKLIAEATRSIENIEAGQLTSLDQNNNDLNSYESPNDFQENPEILSRGKNEPHVNGVDHLSSSNHKNSNFDTSSLLTALNSMEPLAAAGLPGSFTEVTPSYDQTFSPQNVAEQSETTVDQVSRPQDRYSDLESSKKASRSLEVKQNETSGPSTKIKKKWVCGRLIEVEDQSEEGMERHK